MAKEEGLVNENLEAVLRIELADSASIDCVLDTGFNGNLILPVNFVEKHSPSVLIRVQVELAEGKTAEVGMTTVEIKWLGKKFPINVLVSETDECLIGTELLVDSLLEIDYKNRLVKITK